MKNKPNDNHLTRSVLADEGEAFAGEREVEFARESPHDAGFHDVNHVRDGGMRHSDGHALVGRITTQILDL